MSAQYAEQLAPSAPGTMPEGLYGMTGRVNQRLTGCDVQLEKILNRLRGMHPEPPSDIANKSATDPSFVSLGERTHSHISSLEDKLAELATLIG